MKKLIALFFVAILAFSSAIAEEYSYDQSQQTAKCYVLCPIEIDPQAGALDLGVIRPGEQNVSLAGVGTMDFFIKGGNGSEFGARGTVTKNGSGPGSGTVMLETCRWTYTAGAATPVPFIVGTVENSGSKNGLTLTGSYGIHACNGAGTISMQPGILSASPDASMGDWTFNVTLEVDYQGF